MTLQGSHYNCLLEESVATSTCLVKTGGKASTTNTRPREHLCSRGQTGRRRHRPARRSSTFGQTRRCLGTCHRSGTSLGSSRHWEQIPREEGGRRRLSLEGETEHANRKKLARSSSVQRPQPAGTSSCPRPRPLAPLKALGIQSLHTCNPPATHLRTPDWLGTDISKLLGQSLCNRELAGAGGWWQMLAAYPSGGGCGRGRQCSWLDLQSRASLSLSLAGVGDGAGQGSNDTDS
ncbi:hypothetical protein Cadr_000029854 [Camelus dromedarius]|uniref:Uncharacterized protein n=1 Tax=Camelus dromedarius TaxID=9838 RepID=A0A5N4CCX3_CAMDR|nr:hypothetical protein Cadr_000029854 [Camelus dromedarius]